MIAMNIKLARNVGSLFATQRRFAAPSYIDYSLEDTKNEKGRMGRDVKNEPEGLQSPQCASYWFDCSYKSVAVWEDKTVAYQLTSMMHIKDSPDIMCAHVEIWAWRFLHTFDNSVYFHSCMLKGAADALCDFTNKTKPLGDTLLDFHHHGRFRAPANFRHVVCPRGHVTHSFLATDRQSVCWTEEELTRALEAGSVESNHQAAVLEDDVRGHFVEPVMTSPSFSRAHSDDAESNSQHQTAGPQSQAWSAPVETTTSRTLSSQPTAAQLFFLPPTFTCNNVQLVPYSLVCDFRPDCVDASDEDFCVYERCTGSTPFSCSDGKQVGQRAVVLVIPWCAV
jgi:hypothetical protein